MSRTITAPSRDQGALERLEAEFLGWGGDVPEPVEIDLAEMLAPVIGRLDDDPVCKSTKLKTGKGCCA